MSEKQDYYKTLGVDKQVDESALKRAYRKLAMKYHPDKNPDDAEAEQKFKEINEAYEILSNPEKRQMYDQYGHDGVNPNMGGGGFGGGFNPFDLDDLMSQFFGSGSFGGSSRGRNTRRKGQVINLSIELDFVEAAFGTKREISFLRTEECENCKGTGAKPGTKVSDCSDCSGTGKIRTQKMGMFGVQIHESVCSKCSGRGKIIEETCSRCKGKSLVRKKKTMSINVPAGVDNGQVMPLRTEGNLGQNGGPRGDVNVHISVREHEIFERDGYDIYCEMPITFEQAALGAEIVVPTLEDKIKHSIPEGTQTGTVFRFRNKGIKRLNSESRGDQFIKVVIETPRKLNEEQKELLRKFAKSTGNDLHEKQKGFFDKVKDMFT